MSDLMSVPVYNRNSAAARDILTKVPSEDIGQETVPCTLKFRVKDAFWKEQRLANGLHRPYLELNGEVQEMFIEQDDDRIFMCGSKSVTMDEPQDVRISWILSTNELANLVQKGLLYDDFETPPGLVDGILEIPGNVTYTCVYDTPITMVSVASPWEIQTSTRANHYDNLFNELWQVSPQRAREEHKDFVYSFDAFAPSVAPAPESPIKDYFDDDVPKGPQETYISPNLNEEEALVAGFEAEIQEEERKRAESIKQTEANASKRKAALNFIRAKHKADKDAKRREEAANEDLYEQLMSNKSDDSDANSSKLRYDDIKKGVQSSEYTDIIGVTANNVNSVKSEADAKKSRAMTRLVDIVNDLNAVIKFGPNADTSGFGATFVGDDGQALTKSEADAKKSMATTRLVDIVNDLQAVIKYGPNADISGFGASEAAKPSEEAYKNYVFDDNSDANLNALADKVNALKDMFGIGEDGKPLSKAEASTKKSVQITRLVDIVNDLNAMIKYGPHADTSGFGAKPKAVTHEMSQSDKAAAARNALGSLLGGNRTPEQQGPDSGYI